jgi:4a-hydroxytetrahydrobiopterin dehydratase
MTSPLTPDARARFAVESPHWTVDGEVIEQTFTFGDFSEAMGFVTRVAIAAERADHHPDIDIRWNQVSLRLTTHSVNALTAKDTELAAVIDALAG